MARTVRNQKLDTRSARCQAGGTQGEFDLLGVAGARLHARLPQGAKGRSMDCQDRQGRAAHHKTLGPADDALDPDGVLAISYADAQTRAREWFSAVTKPERPATGPYMVRDAVADYLDWFRATGKKSIKETEASVSAFILPRLGDVEIGSITPARLRKWHMDIAAAPPRLRTRPGEKQKVRDTSDDPEAQRRRRASRKPHPDGAQGHPQSRLARGQSCLRRSMAPCYPIS